MTRFVIQYRMCHKVIYLKFITFVFIVMVYGVAVLGTSE
jgi:hypothetical protein